VNETTNGKPLRASVVTGLLFVGMAVVMAWAGWSIRDRTEDNAEVLCNVLAIGRQARIERLAVTPGTADELKAQLEQINEVYDRISSPIRNCDVRRTVVRP
jgi:hypothetical protein